MFQDIYQILSENPIILALLLASFITGFISWCICMSIKKPWLLKKSDVIATVLSTSWLGVHLYWFFSHLDVPFLFDIVWVMCVLHLIWENSAKVLIELLSN